MAEILDSLMSNPLKKTHITFKCNLDSRAVTKYLTIMQNVGLVEKSSSDKSLYKITEKGVKYRTQFNTFMNMMEEDIQRVTSQKEDFRHLLENLKPKIRN